MDGTRYRGRLKRLLAGALGLAALVAGGAFADYRQSYLDGVRAARRGEWEEAARRLVEAVRERPVEQARARLVGAIPEPYLPHHYLGLAHYHLRRCDEALREWRLSAEQGAVRAQPALSAEAGRLRSDCEALGQAEERVAAARVAATRLSVPELAPALQAEPGLAARRREADGALALAEGELRAAKERWDFAAAAAAGRRAEGVAAELTALAAEALRREGEGRADAAAQPGGSAGGAPPSPAPEPVPPATAPEDASPRVELEAPVTAGQEEDRTDAPSAAAPPAGSPPAAPPAVPPGREPALASEPGSERLLDAVQAYFDGDYERALDRLAGISAASQRQRFLKALFGAAARYALYLLGGEKDGALLAAAAEELGEARRAHPDFAPLPDHFSPRFIAFYGRGR